MPRWTVFLLVPLVSLGLLVGGLGLWQHLRADRSAGLAVKHGAASSKESATLADRCTGVMHEEYRTTDDPRARAVPPKLFARLAPQICALGVERDLVEQDGTMTEQAGYDLTRAVMERMGSTTFQRLLYTELAVDEYHLAKPGKVTAWHRCVAMGFGAWDAQPAGSTKPPRGVYRQAVRDVCALGVEEGFVPESGAPVVGSPEAARFQTLLARKLIAQ